jgi:hypothetical protein
LPAAISLKCFFLALAEVAVKPPYLKSLCSLWRAIQLIQLQRRIRVTAAAMLIVHELAALWQARFESVIKGILLSTLARQVSAGQRVIDGENLQSFSNPRRRPSVIGNFISLFIYNLILFLRTFQIDVLKGLSHSLLHRLPSVLVQYIHFVLNRVCAEGVLHARLFLKLLCSAHQDASFQRLRLLWVVSLLVFFSDHVIKSILCSNLIFNLMN